MNEGVRLARPVLVFGVACDVAAARALDLWSTRVLTPDLAGEQNVVLGAAGGGWGGLLLLNLVQVLLVTAAFAAAVAVQPDVRPRRRNLRFLPFWRANVWGRPRPLRELSRRWPPRRRWLWSVGRFLSWAVVACSLTAAGGNMAAYWWPAARPVWAAMVSTPWSQLAVLVSAVAVAALAWIPFEYACYRGNGPARNQPESMG